jgi:hypothetical protein
VFLSMMSSVMFLTVLFLLLKILQIISIYLRVEVKDKLLDWALHHIQDRKRQLVYGSDL